MSEKRRVPSPAYAFAALLLLVLPCLAVNCGVEPQGGDRPVRLAPWVENVETLACVAMVGTIALLLVLASKQDPNPSPTKVVVMALAHGAFVFLIALPAAEILELLATRDRVGREG